MNKMPCKAAWRIEMKTYGCHNSERKTGYWAPTRIYSPDGSYRTGQMKIEDTSSKECRYDRRATDQQCKGCEK